MSSNFKKDITYNVKKDKRLQAKKRKLEAFLNLVRKDLEVPSQKKKKTKGFTESYETLKEELKKYQTKDVIEPLFFLTDKGKRAVVNFSPEEKSIKCSSPLFFEDLYHLLLNALLGNLSPFSLKWSKLERPQYITKTVLIEIGGLSKDDIFKMNSELNDTDNMFQDVFEIISAETPFPTELSTIHMATNHIDGNFSSLFPIDGNGKSMKEKSLNTMHIATEQTYENVSSLLPKDGNLKSMKEKPLHIIYTETNEVDEKSMKKNVFSKLHLLLSPIQLAMEYCPLPQSVFRGSKSQDYVFSKKSYTPVTDNSPIYAIDCEMCLSTTSANEVTRLAIVDENLQTVYHTFVKPKDKVLDYRTKYSGVTAKMLENVKTTLSDVQKQIERMLPSDAILCGHSINNDLHALKMIHPYVIDTSVIFNQFGIRNRKTSLKNLSRTYLKEVIQNDESGHHPIEDSIATMKLVLLKLQNDLHYGDAVLAPEEYTIPKFENNEPRSTRRKASKFDHFVNLNKGPEYCGFFKRISMFSSKKICLVGDEDTLNNYCLEIPSDKIVKIPKSSNKNVIKATMSNLNHFDLFISHLTLNAENGDLNDIIDGLKQVFYSFPNRTLFLVVVTDNDINDKGFNHRYCMAIVKKAH